MIRRRILLLALVLTSAFSLLSAQTQHLTVEPNHSTIGFRIPISNGITLVTGKFMDFDLSLTLIDGDWAKSSAQFTIQATSINTGIDDRDEHLRSADFFEVEKYPTITFVSEKIVALDDTHFEVQGTFDMHGVSQVVTLPFEVLGQEGNSIGIQIRSTLNRLDYGVGSNFKHTSLPNFLGKEVEVEINFWTKRDKRKKD